MRDGKATEKEYRKANPDVARRYYVNYLNKHQSKDGMKHCSNCKKQQTVDRFHKNKNSQDGLHPLCKDCRRAHYTKPENVKRANEYRKQHYRRNPLSYIKQHLRHEYGITIEQYEEMLSSQGGVCAICSAPHADKLKRRLIVDHCHSTGAIRGLLCCKCNFAIGLLSDDVRLIQKTVSYLLLSRVSPAAKEDIKNYIKAMRMPSVAL